MPRIVVYTPRQLRRGEDKFATLVGDLMALVTQRAALAIQGVVTAATTPPTPTPIPPPILPPAGVSATDVAIISSLWAEQVSATLVPALGATYFDAATDTVRALSPEFPNFLLPAVSDTFAETYLVSAVNRLVGIGNVLWEAARDSLLVGFASGESIPELRDRVRAAANVSQARANVIARTEVISASNAGSINFVKLSGLVGTKEWLATNDARTRCTHRAADGQIVDLNGKFTLGGELECGDFAVAELDRPGDPDAPAGEIIQCRCSLAYDLDMPLGEKDPLVAAAQVHTGAMIALRVTEEDAQRLAVEGFEPANELHVTLMYLGDAADLDEEAVDTLHGIVGELATKTGPITTETFSLNVFNPHTDDRSTAITLGVVGGETPLELIHNTVVAATMALENMPDQHTPWVPHITLAYTDDLAQALTWLDRLGPVTFDRIRLAIGGDVTDYPLGESSAVVDDEGESLVAADFDPNVHPRDTEGKFAKKPGGSVLKIVKTIPNSAIYGKQSDGATIGTSQDGDSFAKYDAKTNKIVIHSKSEGTWLKGKSYGKADAYKKLKEKEGWVLGDPGDSGAVATPNTPPAPPVPKLKKIGSMKSAFKDVQSGDYDGQVIATGKTPSGELVSRYVVHGNGKDAVIAQETWSSTKSEWEPYKKLDTVTKWDNKLQDLKHSSLTTEPIDPVGAINSVPLSKYGAPSAPAGSFVPSKKLGASSTSSGPNLAGLDAAMLPLSVKQSVKQSFKNDDVKWWSNSAVMYPAAQKAAKDNGLTLNQVLSLMDNSSNTKTSPTPFSDKVKKYLGTKKGQQHALQFLGDDKVASSISSGKSSGTVKPPTVSKPNAPTVHFVESTAKLSDADFKVLGVAGANKMKQEMDAEHGSWTPTQAYALQKYTGSAYIGMNSCWRKPPTCTPSTLTSNKNAQAGMRPITQDIKVARGVGFKAFGIQAADYGTQTEAIAKLKALQGKTLIEPGFLSTAVTSSSTWSGAIRLEIDVPKGTLGAWVKPISQHPSEDEFMLAAGLRYRIKEVLPPSGGHANILVRLEVVPE